jgi:hypothetical protein
LARRGLVVVEVGRDWQESLAFTDWSYARELSGDYDIDMFKMIGSRVFQRRRSNRVLDTVRNCFVGAYQPSWLGGKFQKIQELPPHERLSHDCAPSSATQQLLKSIARSLLLVLFHFFVKHRTRPIKSTEFSVSFPLVQTQPRFL